MPGMFHLEDFQLLDWFYYRRSFLGDLFTAGDNYFNFASKRGGNELNKLLPGVLLFCSVPTLSLSPFEVQENGRIELG